MIKAYMVKSRKLHKIDWIVHFILLHSIQPMIYYSRKSLEYFKGFHSYKITVIQYYLNICIVLSHHNVSHVCMSNSHHQYINESWSEFRFNQMNCNTSGWTAVLEQSGYCTSTTPRWTQHLAFFATLNQAG